jgi:hypothetical protein
MRCTWLCIILLYSGEYICSALQYGVREGNAVVLSDEQEGSTPWVILTTVNDGFYDFWRNWFWHYEKLRLLYPVIAVAEDAAVASKLRRFQDEHPLLQIIHTSGLEETKALTYESEGYLKMVSQRPTYILWALQEHAHIIYTDIDTVWLSDPTAHFVAGNQLHMLHESDIQRIDVIRSSNYEKKVVRIWAEYCTGLMGIHRTNTTLAVMQLWEKSLKEKSQLNQRLFNSILMYADDFHCGSPVTSPVECNPKNPAGFAAMKKRLKIEDDYCSRCVVTGVQTLSQEIFPNGQQYFEQMGTDQRAKAVVVHNNFIRGGKAKYDRFKEHKLWWPDLPAFVGD